MPISYSSEKKIFSLHTDRSTYQLAVDRFGTLLHLYYGARCEGETEYLLTFADRGFSGNPYAAGDDRTWSYDALPQEFPAWGSVDFRAPALTVRG